MRQVIQGSVDQSVTLRAYVVSTKLPDTSFVYNQAGIALWYRREGGLKVAITPASLATADTAHSDGGVIHTGDGYIRVDPPDAAVAIGSTGVMVAGTATDRVIVGDYLQLVGGSETPGVVANGTALASGSDTTHTKLQVGTSFGTDDQGNGFYLEVWAGTGAPWMRFIDDWDNATRIAAHEPIPVAADDTTKYRVWFGPSASGAYELVQLAPITHTDAVIPQVTAVTGSVGSVTGAVGSVTAAVTAGTVSDKTGYALSAGGVQAIWDALSAAMTTVGSIGRRLVDNITGDIFARLGAPASSVSADIAAAKADTAAIKTRTDQLTFTRPNHLDSNTRRINNSTVTGDGNGTPWAGTGD